MNKTVKILKKIGFPFSYNHFSEGEEVSLPYICFLYPSSDNFSADGKVYKKINEVNFELYTDKKDRKAERKVEEVLDSFNIFYDKAESYIPEEHMYEILYIFYMEDENEQQN